MTNHSRISHKEALVRLGYLAEITYNGKKHYLSKADLDKFWEKNYGETFDQSFASERAEELQTLSQSGKVDS